MGMWNGWKCISVVASGHQSWWDQIIFRVEEQAGYFLVVAMYVCSELPHCCMGWLKTVRVSFWQGGQSVRSNVYWTVHHCNSWRMKNQLDITCYILFHLLCTQHVSDINISIFRSLRLCWWITTSVVLFSVRCVLELLLRLIFGGVRFPGFSLQNEHHQIPAATKAPTYNKLRTRRPMW